MAGHLAPEGGVEAFFQISANSVSGQLIKEPFVSVNEPWGIAIGSPPPNGTDPTLYVASYQDSAIYEFDAITGAQLPYSIKLSGPPTNITVEPAD
jgi:hypothetical protein